MTSIVHPVTVTYEKSSARPGNAAPTHKQTSMSHPRKRTQNRELSSSNHNTRKHPRYRLAARHTQELCNPPHPLACTSRQSTPLA